jgi:hypothetical protein
MKITKAYLKKLIKEEINDLQVVVENREQDIVKLISDRIPDVGRGDKNTGDFEEDFFGVKSEKDYEEDFKAVKIELEEDGLASEQELEQITFERWKELAGVK